ncbi:MAG: hypothetical protein IPP49_14060 [Saprospiraceae bacterium]|nr:hypothetical protein [Saprospiraceae bacterium]
MILRGVGGLPGTMDTILQIPIEENSLLALYQYILDKTTDLDNEIEDQSTTIYPNPVHKDGEIKVNCNFDLFDRLCNL